MLCVRVLRVPRQRYRGGGLPERHQRVLHRRHLVADRRERLRARRGRALRYLQQARALHQHRRGFIRAGGALVTLSALSHDKQNCRCSRLKMLG